MTVSLRYDAFVLIMRDVVPQDQVDNFNRLLACSVNYIKAKPNIECLLINMNLGEILVKLKRSVKKPPPLINEIIHEFPLLYRRMALLPTHLSPKYVRRFLNLEEVEFDAVKSSFFNEKVENKKTESQKTGIGPPLSISKTQGSPLS